MQFPLVTLACLVSVSVLAQPPQQAGLSDLQQSSLSASFQHNNSATQATAVTGLPQNSTSNQAVTDSKKTAPVSYHLVPCKALRTCKRKTLWEAFVPGFRAFCPIDSTEAAASEPFLDTLIQQQGRLRCVHYDCFPPCTPPCTSGQITCLLQLIITTLVSKACMD